MGSSIIKAFFESNATVISLYLNGRETGHTQTDNKSTSKVQLVTANVTDEQEGEKLVSNILDKNGCIDILVNMVGAYYLVEKIVAELEEKE